VRAGGVLLLNDAYNANPVSAEKALEMLRDWSNGARRRRVAVLGDMLELGRVSESAHRSLGEKAAVSGVDYLVAVGEWGGIVAQGAREAGLSDDRIAVGADADEAWGLLEPELKDGDLVLLKGSRRVGLEVLAERITERHRTSGDGEEEAV
jgi:UDP-N-acetylmuramoyl-tripeptide--D-alanyl-D-alanine ligase